MVYLDSARPDRRRETPPALGPRQDGRERLTRLAAQALRVPAARLTLGAEASAAAGRLAPADPFGAAVVAAGELLVVNDVAADAHFAAQPALLPGGARAAMAAPIVGAGGAVLGALTVGDESPRVWTEAEAQILVDLAATAATELELRRGIAEQESARRRLSESEQRFRTGFHEAALGMAVLALDGRAIEVNPSLERMLGYTAEELRTRSFEDLVQTAAEGADEGARFAELLAGTRDDFQIERQMRAKGGGLVAARLTVSLLHDAEGRARFALALVEDVTSREVLEAMREHNARLQALHELAIGVKHEINNVLATLQGNAELFAASPNLSADEKGGADAMLASVRRLADAVCRLDHVEELPVVSYVGRERMVDLSPERAG